VPESLIAFLESTDYESAIRNAISFGGDADTMACIAGGVAQAFYGAVPEQIAREVRSRLPESFLDVLDRFESRYGSAKADPRTA
jgi:ADP-ribosylglycohydrolase